MKILVIGDPIVDRYLKGSVSRQSPENPAIDVVDVAGFLKQPGGALNVLMNLCSLMPDSDFIYAGPLSEDTLNNVIPKLKNLAVASSGADQEKEIVKMRVVDSDLNQLLRLDFNNKFDDEIISRSNKLFADFISLYAASSFKFDAVVVSDYGKGVINADVIAQLEKLACPIFVDTKNPDLSIWNGLVNFVIKINYSEYEKAHSWSDHAKIVVTAGRDGAWFYHGTNGLFVPTAEVSDANPIGAGDAFLAGLVASYMSTPTPDMASAITYANRVARASVQLQATPIVRLSDVEKETDEFIGVEGSWASGS